MAIFNSYKLNNQRVYIDELVDWVLVDWVLVDWVFIDH